MRFLFFYPETLVGGAQLLFARVAQSLVNRGHSVRIVDYKDGYVSKTLKGWKVPCEFENWEVGKHVETRADELFVFPIADFVRNTRIFKPISMKILLWGIHPNNILGFAPVPQLMTRVKPKSRGWVFQHIFPRSFRRLRRLFQYLDSKNSVVFMDDVNYAHVRDLGILHQTKPEFVPIPCSLQKTGNFAHNQRLQSKNIDVAWLGRLDDDKISAINLSIEFSKTLAARLGSNVTFHLIGHGTWEKRLKQQYEICDNPRFNFHGQLEGDALHRLIRGNVSIGFAMGTSALEFGARDVATVLLDFSKKEMPIENYRFKWLHETAHYNLGQPYSDYCMHDASRHSIDELCKACTQPETLSEIGKKCGSYVRENHNMEAVMDRFLHASQNANASWDIATSLWGKTIIAPDLIARIMLRLSIVSKHKPT